MLLFSFNSFAKSDVISDIEFCNDNMYAPMQYSYLTSCGVTAVSYSYEQVSLEAYLAWGKEKEEWYCEEL